MEKTTKIQTNPRYQIVSSILGFFIWGGWAFYANKGFGLAVSTISGLTQGIASLIITLVMIHIVTWIFRRIKNKYLRSILPATITVCLTGACVILIHHLVGTPEIIRTVTPGLICAFFFCLLTTHKLKQIPTVA